ncbi:DUF4255 domain-containing protein [Blastococcus saxobsidens]|uniref:Pvc16 N-terminal domain-containing protein n=1 Tax=Blastococcus saxobsidens (strain DD2) TaxID=1146883 RepID=H6RPH8_BLASD|nr:DUF4255 domain-containing protein [Blastococcus saxobsidens]CCG04037.1 conserved protein of unknown function [Blastococcus saxobsidens DD2]
MSTGTAVAGTTEAMRKLLEEWLAEADVDSSLNGVHATVTAKPPDQHALSGSGALTGLNLFVHRVSLNQGWRNVDLPSVDALGHRTANPPLAIDLHVVLSAYGPGQLAPEHLLGHGMQALHQHPVLTRGELDALLGDSLGAGLSAQVEQLRITPEALNAEEASRLWAAFGAKYRPSFYYRVSVVLIEGTTPARSPLPVLTRGERLPGNREAGVDVASGLTPRYPILTGLRPAGGHPVAVASGTVTADGELLAGSSRVVRLVSIRRQSGDEVDLGPGTDRQHLTFTVPGTLAVGTYDVLVVVQAQAGDPVRTTNRLSLMVAPAITSAFPLAVTRDGQGDATITVTCAPPVEPDQTAALILGSRETPAEGHATTTGSLTFVVRDAPVGTHLARLRVDGVESIVVDRNAIPPAFLPLQVVIS